MCGINGAFAYRSGGTIEAGELARTRDYMRARGPDGKGEWMSLDGSVGLGHRRLAIIELSALGAQPMHSADGRFAVTFNGEIYNYRELRAELEAEGARFRSHSDTEILLELYRRDGARMVDRLRGMFAFGIWDRDAEALFLARDPYGIKPLYYADDGRTLRFASQVRALLAGGRVSSELSPAGVTGFLLWGSVPEPFTVIEGICLLPAGATLTAARGRSPAISRYWSIEGTIQRSVEAAEGVPRGDERAAVREALLDSVRAHLVADVPVGAFLSAGFDSSTVVGLASEVGAGPIHTITVSFEDFRGKPLDEMPLARAIARHLGVLHTPVELTMAEVEAELPAFFAAMDQPTIDGINTWLVSKAAARAGLKVALSGLGGDELLGGYSTFRTLPDLVARYGPLARIPGLGKAFRMAHVTLERYLSLDPARAGLIEIGGSWEGAYSLCRGIFMPWELDALLERDFVRAGLAALRLQRDEAREAGAPCLSPFAQVVALESGRYMRNQLLRDSDWASMAHSLEVRVPLVDRDLTERVVGLAVAGRLGAGKSILPACLAEPLPRTLLDKPKTGFTVPIWKWLRKSPSLAAWKRVKALHRPKVHDYRRLAYSVLAGVPGAQSLLR